MNILLKLKFKEWKSVKHYNGTKLDKGHKKIVLFNWPDPNTK